MSELLRFATAGSVDDGKSTLIGRLLHDAKAVFEDQLEGPPTPVSKGVGVEGLASAVATCAAASPDGRARVETDLRAHLCPSRRPLIERAATALGDRLARSCPACRAPGWGQVGLELGVPCAWCGADVGIVRGRILGCAACPTQQVVDEGAVRADPARCLHCNP